MTFSQKATIKDKEHTGFADFRIPNGNRVRSGFKYNVSSKPISSPQMSFGSRGTEQRQGSAREESPTSCQVHLQGHLSQPRRGKVAVPSGSDGDICLGEAHFIRGSGA